MSGGYEEIHSFIADGKTACTFATIAARRGQIDYVTAPQAKEDGQSVVYPAVRTFLRGGRKSPGAPGRKTALLFVDDEIPADPETQRTRAFAIREEICLAIARLWWSSTLKTVAQIRREVITLLAEEHQGVIGPEALGQQTVMFAMGPLYPLDHHRYAPQLTVPVTLRADAEYLGQKFPMIIEQMVRMSAERFQEAILFRPFYEEIPDRSAQRPI